MKSARFVLSLAVMILIQAVGGCSVLRPSVDQVRYFSLRSSAGSSPTLTNHWGIGLSRVALPQYLQSRRMVERRGEHELGYSENLRWAENLEQGIQRSLAASLNSLLGASNCVLTEWRRHEVDVEVYVSFQRFEHDSQGRAVLEARWRIADSGARTNWQTGFSRIVKSGPTLNRDPAGAAAALSDALDALGMELASALQAACPGRPVPHL